MKIYKNHFRYFDLFQINLSLQVKSKLETKIKSKLCNYPHRKKGKITGYTDDHEQEMPGKIIEMGLIPDTVFEVLYQAPFGGPLYIEFGVEKSRVALREEEARYILVEAL